MMLRNVYTLTRYGYGYGYGYGSGSGYGSGYGSGSGSGSGYGDGYGYGYGSGSGSGYGSGDGDGDGDGDGYGSGSGSGSGSGKYFIKIWGEWFEVGNEIENSICYNIPPHHHDKIDCDFLQRVNNLEALRILRDKIGLEKYLSLFDAKVIHAETDHQGYPMKLYEYDEKGQRVLLLEVTCPSTGRLYHLYPPNQNAKTCFEAKRSTFGDKALSYRHGDIGLFNLKNDKVTIPFSET